MLAPGTDTIFATASAVTRSAVTLVRVSGPNARRILRALAGDTPPPRVASLRRLRNAAGEELDRGLVLWFPQPRSFTGEDSVELHLHGGRAVTEAVAMALSDLGARPAEPGEFTRRAFLNGKCDLLEAEAVADLIDAETQAQRRQALHQLDGALGALFRDWAERVTGLLARQEALIDFPDEDLPDHLAAACEADMRVLSREMSRHLQDGHRGEHLREGLVFAIVGEPNVGKSSLINALAAREVAIVAATPGTTRDVLEARIVLGDVPVTVLDTAGLRETPDPIEAEGVRRARARAADAHLVVRIVDATRPSDVPSEAASERSLIVANKVDLAPPPAGAAHAVSATTGMGLAALRATLATIARDLTTATATAPLTRLRHRVALAAARDALDAAVARQQSELRAEELRLAIRALGRVTGHVGVEDVLDSVFSQFCIGK